MYSRMHGAHSERRLTCLASYIDPKAWTQALVNIDRKIMEFYDQSDDLIIISLPYKLSEIRTAIAEFVSSNFNDASLLNCFEIAIDYLISNKKHFDAQTKF
eukprot:267418_1